MPEPLRQVDGDAPDARRPGLNERAASLVNPASGLANDYLNRFNEIVMLVEQLPIMAELVDDILAWRPIGYRAYFEGSVLPGRQTALEAYEALDARFRVDFEAIVADLDRMATGFVAAVRLALRRHGHGSPELAEICERAGASMRETLERASNLVNFGTRSPAEDAQRRADRLLASRIISGRL